MYQVLVCEAECMVASEGVRIYIYIYTYIYIYILYTCTYSHVFLHVNIPGFVGPAPQIIVVDHVYDTMINLYTYIHIYIYIIIYYCVSKRPEHMAPTDWGGSQHLFAHAIIISCLLSYLLVI